jgi:hypothetical protein
MTSYRASSHNEGELRVERGVWGFNERHAERFVDRWCLRTTRDDTDLFSIKCAHEIALSSDTRFIEMESDELLWKTSVSQLEERISSDEIALIELHNPSKSTLKRGDILGEFMAVQRKRGLKTERITRAETTRKNAKSGAVLKQKSPQIARFFSFYEDLNSILAGISGTGDDHRRAQDLTLNEVEVFQR